MSHQQPETFESDQLNGSQRPSSFRIDLVNVTKRLGGVDILAALKMSMNGGNIVALLGANGAGKTTLLHVLAGLYQPDEGQILIDDEPMSRLRMDQRRRLHYLPDIPILNPGHTPLDYIVYALEAYGVEGDESDQKILDLLVEFDLLAVSDVPCSALSRGQRYKATLIALLAADPDFWIMDEPFTSGMDPLGLSAMRRHLKAARNRGRLIIYSTQLVEVAQQTSDLVCVLSETKVAAYGTASSLTESAENSPQLNDLFNQLRGKEDEVAPSEKDTH